MKKPKVKSWKSDTVPESKMILRMVEVRRETANDDDKSIEVVIASENPVERFDEETGDIYQEILDMDGLVLRGGKDKLPIVDSHDRSTVRNVYGSVRGIHRDSTELVGRASFARDTDSQDAYWKLKDGHLDDFSITATPNETQRIQRGETGVWRDQDIDGPVDIHTDWMPTDASLVAVGADETSTQRSALLRSYYDLNREVKRMNETQMTALRDRGMPEDVETVEQALQWSIDHMAAADEEQPIQNEDETEDVENEDEPEDEIENEDEPEKEVENKRTAIEKKLITRQREIRALCQTHKISRKFADSLCEDPRITLPIARKRILKKMETKPLGTGRVSVGSEGIDRMRNAMRDGMIARAAIATGKTGKNPFATQFDPNAKPAEGYEEFSKMTLLRMAQAFLHQNKVNTNRMTNPEMAMVAMGHPPTINRMARTGIIRADGDAWHTTGTFTNLLLDAINKELRDGYAEPVFTWDVWARQGTSTQDLKEINRIQYSEFPDLQDVPEGDKYPEGKTSDAKESYKPQKKGRLFTITWETIVNDDLDAISRIPAMQGVAARRKQNKSVYAILTDNAKMADGGALFNSTAVTTAGGHNNLASSGAAISETTLNAAYASMMIQPNLEGEIAGAVPKFLIVPPSISGTAIQLVVSMTPPTVGGDVTGTSGTKNIYGPQGERALTVVVEPQLEANSSTAWYLAADKATIDTVELTFLAGEETPVLESDWDLTNDTYCYKIRQTWGTKAIDWRGLFKNPGA